MDTSRFSAAWTRFTERLRFLTSMSLIVSMLAPNAAFAATRYWRGDADDRGQQWDNTDNWAATVTGATGASIPGAADTVSLDSSIMIQRGTGQWIKLKNNTQVEKLILSPTFSGRLLVGSSSLIVGSGGIRMGSGRLNFGTGSKLNISGSYVQTGGIMSNSVANHIFSLSGDLIVNRAGRIRYSGTVLFEGWQDQNFAFSGSIADGLPVTQAVGQSIFSGIILNSVGAAGSDDLIVSGATLRMKNLTITNGTFDLQQRDTKLNSSGFIAIGNDADATLEAEENIRLSGSLTTGAAGRFILSGGTLIMNGKYQNLDVEGVASEVHNLQVSASSGVTLTSNIRVLGTLTIDSSSTLTFVAQTLYATGATITNNGSIKEDTGKLVHSGSTFMITNSSYASVSEIKSGETAYFTVTDSDENISGTAADTLTITVALAGGDSETVTLTETAVASGIFRGSLPVTNASATSSDGTLQGAAEAVMTATYTDAQDARSITDTTNFSPIGSSTTNATGGGGGGGGVRSGGGGGGKSVQAVKPSTPTGILKQDLKSLTSEQRKTLAREKRMSRINARKARVNARREARLAKWKNASGRR
ncbi:MAG: hypothetical protein Q7R81_06015 [Candidatus Peregrinibacteria bacterium]|nr:hypothetical protein [Candidatus Peregrinibacteria bacterium]